MKKNKRRKSSYSDSGKSPNSKSLVSEISDSLSEFHNSVTKDSGFLDKCEHIYKVKNKKARKNHFKRPT